MTAVDLMLFLLLFSAFCLLLAAGGALYLVVTDLRDARDRRRGLCACGQQWMEGTGRPVPSGGLLHEPSRCYPEAS